MCPPFSSGLLKLIFGSRKAALVTMFVHSTYKIYYSEAQNSFFLAFKLGLNQAFYFDDHVINEFLIITNCYIRLPKMWLNAVVVVSSSTTTSDL